MTGDQTMKLILEIKPFILIIAFVCTVHSCVDPVDFSKGDDSTNLVVDGMITNETGPYTVYLTRTTDYNSYYSSVQRVKGAIVMISDDLGNVELLTETYLHGIYKTDPDGIRGLPGRQYKLEIETPDGIHYESDYELLSPVPDIDTIYYERQIIQELDDRSVVQDVDGFQIYIGAKDPEDVKNYYMWSWTGTHEVHTQPWLFMYGPPKDCCATCWLSEHTGEINVYDDVLLGGSQIDHQAVAFIRLKKRNGARHFRGKYHVEVKQFSVTKEAYEYWSSIGIQIGSSGSIFEPPPEAIAGNITNCDSPEDIVFGYFGASSISTKSIFIPASEAPYPPDDILDWPDDCRMMGNSTAFMPSFW
jgi:uncharacterized protein DUF4249